MDYEKRKELVNRISSGTIHCDLIENNGNVVRIRFDDPCLNLLTEADYYYNKTLEKGRLCGLLSEKEAVDTLKHRGIWSDQLEFQLQKCKLDIDNFSKQLPLLRFHKQHQKILKKGIETAKKHQQKLLEKKNSFYQYTAKYYAECTRKRFIVSKITTCDKKIDLSIIDRLVNLYYIQHSINSTQIRYLARTNPWRIYWGLAKNTGTSLFEKPAVEITDLQFELVAWSKIYDNAYESTNRPSQDTIDDDDKFDEWHISEVNKIEQEDKKRIADSMTGHRNGTGAQEVFIPADKEGAKDVYDLNTSQGRKTIQTRQSTIKEQGEVQHGHLPDVKRSIQMQRNQEGSQAVQNRTK